jgi:hypothetical protein
MGFIKVDWEALRDQKQTLVKVIDKANPADSVALMGILHLIDSLQDYAVDVLNKEESLVFGITDNAICAICGETKMDSDDEDECVNGHDDWVSIEDYENNLDFWDKALINLVVSTGELKKAIQNNMSLRDRANHFSLDYNARVLRITFKGSKYIFDLDEGDTGDFWHSFTHNGEIYDVNFAQEDASYNPVVSAYRVIGGATETNESTSLYPRSVTGRRENYFRF